ncbi:hypothetical protein Syun_018805 [Stephania yunnanensis]|uniref:Uncharacterized protein n=1 Tax=Stephania yunnanensis TaxID=152371 RepID=A0AAP0IUH7_9MAGN
MGDERIQHCSWCWPNHDAVGRHVAVVDIPTQESTQSITTTPPSARPQRNSEDDRRKYDSEMR